VAFAVNCATVGVSIIAALVLRIILARLNKKLDRGEYVEGAVQDVTIPGEAARMGFRFLL
jgi:hypothetical protein